MELPGGNRNVRLPILHGYSLPVNHDHLKEREKERVRERGTELLGAGVTAGSRD